jgi:hypothetical protein
MEGLGKFILLIIFKLIYFLKSFCFSFSEKIKQFKNFQDDKLYFSVFSEEPFKIIIKAKFFDPDSIQRSESKEKKHLSPFGK